MLRFLFGSLLSKSISNRLGRMFAVRCSSFSIKSDNLSK